MTSAYDARMKCIAILLVSGALLAACGKSKPAATTTHSTTMESTEAAPDGAAPSTEEESAEGATKGAPAPDGADPCGGGE